MAKSSLRGATTSLNEENRSNGTNASTKNNAMSSQFLIPGEMAFVASTETVRMK